ncbi:hypothetical protein PHAVU_004G056500 [Phaseolus vulgaris]|uniref:Uncharacterized protein n=1 Tax=Phaseolus vulgaris TaxID=3885 RepID=V7C2E9_PHAVU|nr:hypothetical protein PHAVU_004G056500g [Phaseolus vulgaris]ESW23548.1 hypothetical protein PHAVU_004G056500g [Phaseolus vulgaris]
MTSCQTSEVSRHLPLLPMTTRKAQKLDERGEKARGENGCGENASLRKGNTKWRRFREQSDTKGKLKNFKE